MSREETDVIVVGTGVVGLATARELARGGASVIVLERGQPGREASRAAAGIICPVYPWREPKALDALVHWSRAYYPVLAEDLRRQTGVDAEWRVGGILVFDEAERDAGVKWARDKALPYEVLDPDALARVEPALAGTKRSAFFLPTVGQIHSSRLLRGLNEAVMQEGVPVRQHTEVTGLVRDGAKVVGVETAAGPLFARRGVVLATGAWTSELLATAGLKLEVFPVRGQVIQFEGPAGLLGRVLLEDGHYVLQRRGGHILVGSTKERVGFDKDITEEAAEQLMTAGAALLPMLEGAKPNRQWSGLRPGTADAVPYMGEHPQAPGLWVNTGHYANGMTLAPAAGRLVADLVLGRAPILDPKPFALDR
jgi:glycine oxidase